MSELETNDRDDDTWIQNIDRGGLWRVNEDTYLLLYAIEEEIRCHFTVKSLQKQDTPSREEAIYKNEDVKHLWMQLTLNHIDSSMSTFLLEEITCMYMTIRGHAFATSCLELYKQCHSKKIQKSKALRRELTTD